MIAVTGSLEIPESELTFTATRSSGPGGQHVNKTATRITLRFDVARSPSLSAEQRQRILERLATRVSGEGILSVVSQRHRSQARNRQAALERFVDLLRAALARARSRTPTRATAASRERRVREKKERAQVKAARRRPASEEG